jgi:hypothetical protein
MRLHGRTRRGIAACATGLGLALLAPAGAGATVFSFGGSEQQYDVPVGARAVAVLATGAPGGSGDSGAVGGHGSTVRTTLPVRAGEILYVNVGLVGPDASGATGGSSSAGAFGGGGADGGSVSSATADAGGAGGGASAIRTCSLNTFLCFLSAPALVIAGGGGGGGGGSGAGAGGAGGGVGSAGTGGATAGNPGSATKGGKGGSGGIDGTLLAGGTGASGSTSGGIFFDGGGGGGGGGLWGGGGGGASGFVSGDEGGGGGGGGSSGVSSGATGTTIAADATGVPLIVITPIPMAPSCANNAFNTLPGGSTVVVPLQCTTPMGVPISYVLASGPRHGRLRPIGQEGGSATYTPNAGFSGTDSFTFTASNSGGKSSAATVTITVPPRAAHCTVPKLKGGSLSGAKRKLAAAGCALGKVTKKHKHRRHPVVVGQGTPAGATRRLGAKVSVTLG